MRRVARGVTLIQEITPDGAPNGPLVVTVLRVDPREKGVRVEAALGQDTVWSTDPTFGREIVSRIAARRKAVAGVNAGFFPFAGNPIGLHVEDGDLVTEPTKQRTSFFMRRDKTFGFAAYTYRGTVAADGKTVALDGLNRRPVTPKNAPSDNELLLFTPIFGPRTLPATGRVEVILKDAGATPLAPNRAYSGVVAASGEGGNTVIAPGTVVLSGGGTAAEFLRAAVAAGVPMTFSVGVTPVAADAGPGADPAGIVHAVTGAPRIVSRGRPDIRLGQEEMGRSFSTTRHPRTAAGRAKDGALLLVTVDGRQKGLSRGASLPELADLMIRLGAVEAVNLDGGGSSAAVTWDTVTNSPSEGVERAVADMLLVYADDLPDAKGKAPSLAAPARPLTVGETWDFAAPAKLSADERAVWGTKGGVGFVSQRGVFRAQRPGRGTVIVTLGGRGRQASVPVTVAAAPTGTAPLVDAAGFSATLTLTPDPTAPDSRATLTVRVANAEGDPLGGEPVMVTVIGGTIDPAAPVTDAKGIATAAVQWDGTTPAASRSVRVTSPRKRFRDAETRP